MDAFAAKEAALTDAQGLADVLLDAESKLGGMLSEKPLAERRASSARGTCTLPPDIDKKQSHYAQTLARNPEVVEEVKAENIPSQKKGRTAPCI